MPIKPTDVAGVEVRRALLALQKAGRASACRSMIFIDNEMAEGNIAPGAYRSLHDRTGEGGTCYVVFPEAVTVVAFAASNVYGPSGAVVDVRLSVEGGSAGLEILAVGIGEHKSATGSLAVPANTPLWPQAQISSAPYGYYVALNLTIEVESV